MRGWIGVAIVLASCGRVGFEPDREAGPAIDAGRDAGPIEPPAPIGELNSPSDENDPSLTSDELEIVFVSSRGGRAEIWTATRASIGSAWSTPVRAPGLEGISVTDPELSSDGLHLFFTAIADDDLHETTRAARGASWSAPTRVAELSSPRDECCAAMSEDGLRVVFASGRAGAAPDLFRAARGTTATPWGAIEPVAELATSSTEANPHWTLDELTLLFDSDRPGGSGRRDLYFATRAARGEAFSSPVRLSTLATGADDKDGWISTDGRRVWLASDRNGNYDLYSAGLP